MSGKVKRLDHLGIAVRDPRARLDLWASTLGLELERVEAVESEGVRTWFLDAGNTHLELLEPLGEGSPIAKALDKRGEGIHHMCLEVEDIEAVLAGLARTGIEPVGILLELSEKPAKDVDSGGAGLAPGELVVLYLKDPKERLVGLLEHLDGAGVLLEGLDLEGWEDLLGQYARGEEQPIGPSRQYFPIGRVEKILADRDAGDLPSLARQFHARTGLDLKEVLRGHRDPSHEEAD
jgi:methylmalonyl-CoA epimerase